MQIAELFEENARALVFGSAEQKACSLGYSLVYPHHILLVLLESDYDIARILRSHGVTPEFVYQLLERSVGRGSERKSADSLRFHEQTWRVLDTAKGYIAGTKGRVQIDSIVLGCIDENVLPDPEDRIRPHIATGTPNPWPDIPLSNELKELLRQSRYLALEEGANELTVYHVLQTLARWGGFRE